MQKNYNSPAFDIDLFKDDIVRCSGGGDSKEDLDEELLEAALWLHLAHVTKPDKDNRRK